MMHNWFTCKIRYNRVAENVKPEFKEAEVR